MGQSRLVLRTIARFALLGPVDRATRSDFFLHGLAHLVEPHVLEPTKVDLLRDRCFVEHGQAFGCQTRVVAREWRYDSIEDLLLGLPDVASR